MWHLIGVWAFASVPVSLVVGAVLARKSEALVAAPA